MPTQPAPAVVLTPGTLATASAMKPPASAASVDDSATAAAAACACLNDGAEGPVVRAKCVQRLRENTSPEATACLRAFLEANEHELEGMKSEDPTPEQEIILDAENALRAKAREVKSKAAAAAMAADPNPHPELKPPDPALVSPKVVGSAKP